MKFGLAKISVKVAIICLVMASILALAVFGCAEPEPTTPATPETPGPAEKPPITYKVGVITPITGTMAAVGESQVRGSQLAVDHINHDGWFVINGQKYIIELIPYDTRGDEKTGVAMANKMVQDGIKLDAYLPLPEYLPESGPLEAAKIISFAPSFPNDLTEGRKYTFAESYNDMAGKIARLSMAPTGQENEYTILKNVNKVAIIGEQNVHYQTIVPGFYEVNEILGNGIEIVYDQAVTSDTTDFSSVIKSMMAKNPDVVYNLAGLTPSCLVIYKQLREAGFKGQIINHDNLTSRDPQSRIIATDAADGTLECMFYVPEADASIAPSWVADALGYDPDMLTRYRQDKVAEYGVGGDEMGILRAYSVMYAALYNAWKSGDPMNPDAVVAQVEKGETVKTPMFGYRWSKVTRRAALPLIYVQMHDIDPETGSFQVTYIGGGRSLDDYAVTDFAKAEFEWVVGQQIDVSTLK